MQCTIVIPCHNGEELTRECLHSLIAQRGDHDLEILLVDNASTDGTASLAELDPRIRILPQATNLGFAAGVNQGLRQARSPFVLVLNNDTQAASGMLEELHAVLASDPQIGAVAPVSNFVKGPARLDLGQGTRDPEVREAVAAELARQRHLLQDVDSLAGLCLLLRRSALEEVGLFDERFGRGNYEDDDLSLRLRLHGYRLVIARSAFLHHEGHATFRAIGLDLPTELRHRHEQFTAKWLDDPAGRATIATTVGQPGNAAQDAAAARELWPDWPDADWHQGRGLALSGQHEAAAVHFRSLLERCPRHTDAAFELSLCLLNLGDATAAQRQLAWVSAHCHVPAEAHKQLLVRIGEYWYSRGDWQAAQTSFQEAIESSPDDGALHNWLGSCLLEQQDLEAATAAFERAAELDYGLAHTNLGICAHRRGDLAAAERHFLTACEKLPDDPVAKRNLAAFQQQPAGA